MGERRNKKGVDAAGNVTEINRECRNIANSERSRKR